MRVQNINQNYPQSCRKQNAPSFQATGILISKEIQGSKVAKLAEELDTAFDEKVFGFTQMIKSSIGESVPDHIVVNTSPNLDEATIPLVENFAKNHGFSCSIKPDGSKTADSLVTWGWLMARKFAREGHL